ncbi:glycosyltransferase [Chloroflexales bacterium ZM16-3]|nr:glycosyltransferase [Chloroflexales bacterium ZM16-3]
MSEATITISAVLPMRNQASTLAATMAEYMAGISRQCPDHEIILVDDGSSDGTARQADYLAAAYDSVMVIHQPEPRGYAAALRTAWQVARGDYIFAASISGPAGIADLPRLLAALGDNAVVVGYRARPPRTPLALIYAAAVRTILSTDLRDPAIRFSLFRSDLAELLTDDVPDGLAHAEIYARAKQAGMPVAQVAISGRRGRVATAGAAMIELASYRPPSGGRQGALMGATALLVAGGLWLMRRRSHP